MNTDRVHIRIASSEAKELVLLSLSAGCSIDLATIWHRLGICSNVGSLVPCCPLLPSCGPQPWNFTQEWYLEDPLWDGKGCVEGSTCCDGPNRPWFYRELNSTVTEKIEVKMCASGEANLDVEKLEIYVS